MRKAELAQAIASRTGLSRMQATEVVTAFTDQVAQAMAKDQNVRIPGFGAFSVRERSARTGRDPRTGAELRIAASRTVGFKAGKRLKDTFSCY